MWMSDRLSNLKLGRSMVKQKVPFDIDQQPLWARRYLGTHEVSVILGMVRKNARKKAFDEAIATILAPLDSTVTVTMQKNHKFVFEWESEAAKTMFILKWG